METSGSGISCSLWSVFKSQMWMAPLWSPTMSSAWGAGEVREGRSPALQSPTVPGPGSAPHLVGVQAHAVNGCVHLEDPLALQVPGPLGAHALYWLLLAPPQTLFPRHLGSFLC